MEAIQELFGGILGGVWSYVAAGVGVIVSALGLYLKGRTDARRKRHIRDLEAEIEARDRMDAAEVAEDPVAARKWLEERK